MKPIDHYLTRSRPSAKSVKVVSGRGTEIKESKNVRVTNTCTSKSKPHPTIKRSAYQGGSQPIHFSGSASLYNPDNSYLIL